MKHKKEKHARKSRRPQQQYIDNEQVADLEWNIPKVCKRNHMVKITEKWNDMIAHLIFIEISLNIYWNLMLLTGFRPFFNWNNVFLLKIIFFNRKWPFFIDDISLYFLVKNLRISIYNTTVMIYWILFPIHRKLKRMEVENHQWIPPCKSMQNHGYFKFIFFIQKWPLTKTTKSQIHFFCTSALYGSIKM